jgi:probable blue pigment (indigoidine) exporter
MSTFLPSGRSTTFYLVAAAACWGLGTVLSKYALNGFSPAALLPVQLLASSIVLGLALLLSRTRMRAIDRPVRVAALGVLNPGVAYALALIGLSRVDASISVVIWATEPVLIVLLAYLLLRERLTATAVACLATAMVGIALIVGRPDSTSAGFGVVLTFAAVLACALYSVLVRALHLVDGTLPVVWIQQTSALIFALVLYVIVTGRDHGSLNLSGSEAAAAALGGVVYYGLAFLFYVSGLRRTYAARAGSFLTLIPVFGLAFSALLLGERFTPVQLVGAVVVIIAMIILSTSAGTVSGPIRPGVRGRDRREE